MDHGQNQNQNQFDGKIGAISRVLFPRQFDKLLSISTALCATAVFPSKPVRTSGGQHPAFLASFSRR